MSCLNDNSQEGRFSVLAFPRFEPIDSGNKFFEFMFHCVNPLVPAPYRQLSHLQAVEYAVSQVPGRRANAFQG